ncbi:MAG: GGDEF domain-containing protein [Proteobacteria bacterium]|nr:GGDEF domain-containing protein [Pseudomonadota bacterium]
MQKIQEKTEKESTTHRENKKSLLPEPNTPTISPPKESPLSAEQLKKLFQLAYYDDLTGLPNRVLLRDRLEQALARAERSGATGTILYLDLDNFKSVNDSFGHQAGDRVLKETATRLKACIRPQDTAARIGGDEFVILIADLAESGEVLRKFLSGIAQRILTAIAQPIDLEQSGITITASIGIATYPAKANTFEHILYTADTAMYQAKRQGNTFDFWREKR